MRAAVAALVLALVVPQSAPVSAVGPIVERPGTTDSWIVTLQPRAVAPSGVGIAPRAYRLDTPAGRTAAQGRARLTDRTIDRLETSRGIRATTRFRWALQGFSARLTAAQVRQLRLDPDIRSVVPDTPVSIAADTVPLGVQRIGGTVGLASGSSVDIDVAVIDTGVGPVGGNELDIRIKTESDRSQDQDCVSNTSFDVSDRHGHGTHVAGTIGARDNGVGVVGVAPGARIWPVRVFDARGAGSTSAVICGIDWVTRWLGDPANGGRRMVVNMSLRGPDDRRSARSCTPEGTDTRDPEHQAICTATRAGAVIVVAAGNEAADANRYVPARYDEVITVGALSDFDGRAGGLGRVADVSGCAPPTAGERDDRFARYSNWGSVVDVVAPGTCIVSLARSGGTAVRTAMMSGTSMATPHVAGLAARYLEAHPTVTTEQLTTRLVAAAAADWAVESDPRLDRDPDAAPLRRADVAGLLAATGSIRAWPRRTTIGVAQGVRQRTLPVEIQRLGGATDDVTVSLTDLPDGVRQDGGPSVIGGLRGQVTLRIDDTADEGDLPLTLRASVGGTVVETRSLVLRVDRTPPNVAGSTPRLTFRTGVVFDGTARLRARWTAQDQQSGVARSDLQQKRGTWRQVATGTTTGSANVDLARGTTLRMRVRATDQVGNQALSAVAVTRLIMRDSSSSSVRWTGGWQTVGRSDATGRSVRRSTSSGATATLRFTGRAVALVAPQGPKQGKVTVSIDGQAVGTVDLRNSRGRPRRVVFASGSLPAGSHVITVRSHKAGTQLDALLVLE
ncbi:MAG: S8 family serine peptidase [Chloroflexi bacterium]|nr:S8 family serine peptidase [Chloroflexota bacterium]